jgi:hypothetical protein
MKDSRLYIILFIIVLVITIQVTAQGQSFYGNRYDKGRTTQLNTKTVAQKKLTVYQKHSLLYKIRRDANHNRKRRNFAKSKTR